MQLLCTLYDVVLRLENEYLHHTSSLHCCTVLDMKSRVCTNLFTIVVRRRDLFSRNHDLVTQVSTSPRTRPKVTSTCTALVEEPAATRTRTSLATYARGTVRHARTMVIHDVGVSAKSKSSVPQSIHAVHHPVTGILGDSGTDRRAGRKLGQAENDSRGGRGEEKPEGRKTALSSPFLFLRAPSPPPSFPLAPVSRPPHDLPLGSPRMCHGWLITVWLP